MIPWDRSRGRPEPIGALNRILEVECGEPLVDLRSLLPHMPMARPQAIPYARETVANMLVEANAKLPKGIGLALVEAWRPIERQQRIYDFMWRNAVEAFPHRTHAALRRTVCRWVAPTDQKAPPGHCTGGAVDVQLVDEAGETIDVWSPYDRFKAAPTYALGLDEPALRHRMLLVDTMLSVGFSNCRDEWWHYSFGDAGWAVRMGQTRCQYGLAALDPGLYAQLEELSAESFKDRENPFLAAPDDRVTETGSRRAG